MDDDIRIQRMLVQYPSEQGFDIDAVSSSSQMRDKMAAASFDLVLLDLVLPGDVHGLQLAKEYVRSPTSQL